MLDLVSPGEGGVPATTHRRAISRQLKRPAEQILDRWLILGNQDVRDSRGSVCPGKGVACACAASVIVSSRHTDCFLFRKANAGPCREQRSSPNEERSPTQEALPVISRASSDASTERAALAHRHRPGSRRRSAQVRQSRHSLAKAAHTIGPGTSHTAAPCPPPLRERSVACSSWSLLLAAWFSSVSLHMRTLLMSEGTEPCSARHAVRAPRQDRRANVREASRRGRRACRRAIPEPPG